MEKSRYNILHLSDFHLIATSDAKSGEIKGAIKLISTVMLKEKSDFGNKDVLSRFVKSGTSNSENVAIEGCLRKILKQVENQHNVKDIQKAIETIETAHKKTKLKKMIKSFCVMQQKEKYDMVVITGDVYDSGVLIENDEAIGRLLKSIGAMTEHLFIAYGNHDMYISLNKKPEYLKSKKRYDEKSESFLNIRDDKKDEQFVSWIRTQGKEEDIATYTNYEKIVRKILNPDTGADGRYTADCFENIEKMEKDVFFDLSNIFGERKLANRDFWNALENTCGKWPSSSDRVPFSTGVSVVNDDIAVVVLNSAWLNVDSKKCHGQLIVGRPILTAIVDRLHYLGFTGFNGKSKPGKYIVTLLHNDFNWHSVTEHHYDLVKSKEGSCKEVSSIDTIVRFSDIILCGHEHKETATTLLGLDAYVLKVGGTFRTQDPYTDNTFSIYSLDFAFNTLTRKVFNYVAKDDKWEQNKKETPENFTTELKPMDACAKFKQPLRVVDDCFAFLKENALIQNLETDNLQVYDEYISVKHKEWINEAKQATGKRKVANP